MFRIVRLASALCVLLALAADPPSAVAQVERSDTHAGESSARRGLYERLNAPSPYERGKALDELMAVAPGDPATAEALIRMFRAPEGEEMRYLEFVRRVSQAIQTAAAGAAWPPGTVEQLTSTLVHNDAYDSRLTDLTAETVAGVASSQAFSPSAIEDLTTVLWHRVDRNPQRARNDNTRAHAVQALRNIRRRQGLPQAVIDQALASIATERHAGVRRELVVLVDELARSQPASEAMVGVLTGLVRSDESARVRALAARALAALGRQRADAQDILATLQQAAARDADPAVRREALAGLAGALGARPAPPQALSEQSVRQLLQSASSEPSEALRLLAVQSLRKAFAARNPNPAELNLLLERLRDESDDKVRALVAATVLEIHRRRSLEPALLELFVPRVTDDPAAEVRRDIARMIIVEQTDGADLASWMKRTAGMGLVPTEAIRAVALLQDASQVRDVSRSALHARLEQQYATVLSASPSRPVRGEIVQGLFTLSLSAALAQPAADALGGTLRSDSDIGLRVQAAAVLLHDGLLHRGEASRLRAGLDDAEARMRDYSAFAWVESSAAGRELLPVLLACAGEPSAHRNLRLYCLRRLAQWRRGGGELPDSVQAALLPLTAGPDAALRAEAWGALLQFKLPVETWRRAAADDDLAIRRLAWGELRARGVAQPVWATLRDPRQRLELLATGLLGANVLAVLGGAVLFGWRLLAWLRGSRTRPARLLAGQLVWLAAALGAIALNGGIVFLLALAHRTPSEKDLVQLNAVFGGILGLYCALAWIAWKLLPMRAPQRSHTETLPGR